MKWFVTSRDPFSVNADAHVLFVTKDYEKSGMFAKYDSLSKGLLGALISELGERFFDKNCVESLFINMPNFKWIVICGVKELKCVSFIDLSAKVAKIAKQRKIRKIAFIIADINFDLANLSKAVYEGARLGSYVFEKYKSKKSGRFPEEVIIVTSKNHEEKIKSALRESEIICSAVEVARDLVNQPAKDANPVSLAQFFKSLFKNIKNVSIEIFDEKRLEKEKFGGVIAVGKGSEIPPRLMIVKYLPLKNEKPYVLIGKGVCFDAGGLQMKSREGMRNMKIDMAGAAVVMAAVYAIARLQLPVNIIVIVPLVENLPSGKATKPGDVIEMYNGKKVEIAHTDAEGRLILADAIAYAERNLNPEAIIDLATLTGACVIALGRRIAGIMGNNKKLITMLKEIGDEIGEYLWELPLFEEYRELIKSDIADIKNIGDGSAGAIIGGLFLKEFVEKTPWVHIDIAGVSWTNKDIFIYPKGATGYGVRLLVEFIKKAIQ